MVNLNLQQNEAIIIHSTGVLHGGFMSAYTDELVLTNLNVIYINKGMLGKVKNIQKFPLNQIKIINGQPQVMMGKNSQNSRPQVQIFFKNGQEAFEFQSSPKREISNWINNITKVLTGDTAQISNSKNIMAIPGAEQVAETVKDTIGAFKDTFGIGNKKIKSTQSITGKCIGCMAPISGTQGQMIRCKYCDTNQTV